MINNIDKLKNSLKLIEIETFSYCNRKCWFCPNSFVDRLSENQIMNVDDYIDILNQLAEIDFSGEITFSRYNEPLAFKELILDRIKLARKIVPNSILRINTNGDYTTTEYVHELREAGLNQLWIQQYLNNNERYNHEKARKRMDIKVKKLKFQKTVLTDIVDCKLEYDLDVKGMTVHLRARNFEKDGSDRGGTIKIAEEYTRTQPCRQVFDNIYIDFNGQMMVCCALRSDVKDHESGIIGNIKDETLANLFQHHNYKHWREIHSNSTPKTGLCKGCRIDVKPFYEK